jgi:pantoate--beta-alanine ligase
MSGPAVAYTREELAQAQARQRGPVGVVMTMGALHAGHAALIRAARQRCETVVVTVFVNPLQFGPSEDFERYPRTLAADVELCAAEGVDVVFAPSPEVVYPVPAEVRLDPGPLGDELEGAARPGHFAGVLTVVHKLLHIVCGVDQAFFGEKDYQQLALIRRMVRDLDLPQQVVAVPTVREEGGLALSSRNRYLSDGERRSALALSAALRAGVDAGHRGGQEALRAARAVLDAEPGVKPDYLALRAPDMGPAPDSGAARLLVAGWVGTTRLIDNMPLTLGES